MYIKLSQPEIQDNTSLAKPDLAMMKLAYNLFFAGVKPEEIIGFGQDVYELKYITYQNFKENIDTHIKWQISLNKQGAYTCFIPSPNRHDYRPKEKDIVVKNGHTTAKSKSTFKDIVRAQWLFLDLDRKDEIKKDKNNNDIPATQEHLKMLLQANNNLLELLQDFGFKSVLNSFSGNGYGLGIPVNFPSNQITKGKFSKIIKLFNDKLKDEFPLLELDKQFENPRQFISIPGSLNRKFNLPVLRKALNYHQFSPEDICSSRVHNSLLIESYLAENEFKNCEATLENGSSGNKGYTYDPELRRCLEEWNKDHSFCNEAGRGMLLKYGYKISRDQGIRALMLRPDKEGSGHGLIVGGEKNLCYSLSSNDPYFPHNKGLNPYWAYFMLEGIVNKNNEIVDRARAHEFHNEVKLTYKYQYKLDHQINLQSQSFTSKIKHIKPVEPAKPIEPMTNQEPRQATGTLGDTPMPGVIEQIAQDIGLRNPMVSPAIDRAMALAKFQFLMGKSRVHESGTYANSWIVNLAPSSAGKEAGKNYIQRFMNQVAENFESSKLMPSLPSHCFGYKIVGVNGSNGGSSQGIQDELLVNGRVLIIGDESERFLHPTSKNERAIEIRDMLLGVSSRGLLIGRALSQTHTRHTVTNCFVSQIHITQPKPYFEAFTNDNDLKGSIGRYLHFEAPKGLPRFGNIDLDINQELIEQGLYWQGENLRGLERSLDKLSGTMGKENLHFLGKFKPDQIVMRYCQPIDGEQGRVHQYRIYCTEQAKKQGLQGNGILERFWDKAAENALRLAMTYSAAVDREARTISSEAWDLATTHLEGSMKTLIRNRNDILKSKGEAREEAIMAYLKDCWSRGEVIKLNDLYYKFRGQYRNGEASGKQDFDQHLILLNNLEKIKLEKLNTPGVASYLILPFTPSQEPAI